MRAVDEKGSCSHDSPIVGASFFPYFQLVVGHDQQKKIKHAIFVTSVRHGVCDLHKAKVAVAVKGEEKVDDASANLDNSFQERVVAAFKRIPPPLPQHTALRVTLRPREYFSPVIYVIDSRFWCRWSSAYLGTPTYLKLSTTARRFWVRIRMHRI